MSAADAEVIDPEIRCTMADAHALSRAQAEQLITDMRAILDRNDTQ